MKILCCDSCTDYAVYALGDEDGELIASMCVRHERSLSKLWFPTLEKFLAESHVGFEQIDALAVGLGPGSFTGVRVAVTTMRTLAQATGKSLLGVGTLSIYGSSAAAKTRGGKSILAVLPSRRDEVYAGLYDSDGCETRAPFAATPLEIAGIAKSGEVLLCGAVEALGEGFEEYERLAEDYPDPAAFVRLAAAKARCGEFADPLGLNPLYVVAPVIGGKR